MPAGFGRRLFSFSCFEGLFDGIAGNFRAAVSVSPVQAIPNMRPRALPREQKEQGMDGQLIGLVAVILGMGIPLGALYTYYRVRKLRSEERLAAIARGATIPVEPELNQAARSRRAGILLVSGAIGYIVTFGLIAQIEADRDVWTAAALGIIPLAVGVGYFVDWKLIHRDART
jgi:preprotein translocase subunit Sss1